MTRTSAELEREVEDARGRLSQTAEALKEKMQPRDLLDEATTMMGQTGEKMLSTAADHLRENPIPIALIGLGVAWLALESGRRVRRADGLDVRYATHEGYDVGEDDGVAARAKAGTEMAKAKLSKAAEKAKARLADAQSQAEEGVSAARHKAADFVHAAQAKADAYGRAAKTRFDETLDHEPLVIGAIGVAVGAAIGASLPATEAERRYIGPARAKAAERAKESLDGVRHVAERTYAQVKDELRRQAGATGDAP